ncbi:MAG: hypothetical protein E6132_10940 [Actinomyces sp.]|jgi:hypothetical protein|nr:hypothetical protein [Actinomyces sp.]
MRYRIDSSTLTHLPICRDCGWRGNPETSKLAALIALQRHQRDIHPGESQGPLKSNIARARRAAMGRN